MARRDTRPQRKIFALNHRPASLAPDKGSPFLAAQLEPGAVLAKFADFELEQPVERLRSLPVAQVRQSAWPAAVETRSGPKSVSLPPPVIGACIFRKPASRG